MSDDALFQLGMGSVELDAPRTEEPSTRLCLVSSTVYRLSACERKRAVLLSGLPLCPT